MTLKELITINSPERASEMCKHCLLKSDLFNKQSSAFQFLNLELSNEAFLKAYIPYKLGTNCSAAQRVEAWLVLYAEGKMPLKDCVLQILWILGSLTSPIKVLQEAERA